MTGMPSDMRRRSMVPALAVVLTTALDALAAAPGARAAEPEMRVQLSPVRQTVLSSGLAGRIRDLPVREGDRVAEGDRLVAFDCGLHQAQLKRSRAAEAGARKKLSVARRLDKLESISVLEVAEAEAAMGMAAAETEVTEAMLHRCEVTAPFSGRVAERMVQRWEYVPEGHEMLALYDDSTYELEFIVPSRWLSWIAPGQPFTVHLDETETDYPAEVSRIGAVVDPLNQSVKIFGRLTGDTKGLLPGMSGAARLSPPSEATAEDR